PRASYGERPECFGGRSAKQGQTADLVRDAGFVLTHASTAINFAVLYEKPVIFITTDAVENSPEGLHVHANAEELSKPVLNISRSFSLDWPMEMTASKSAYAAYIEKYIRHPGTPDIPLWKIVAEEIKRSDSRSDS